MSHLACPHRGAAGTFGTIRTFGTIGVNGTISVNGTPVSIVNGGTECRALMITPLRGFYACIVGFTGRCPVLMITPFQGCDGSGVCYAETWHAASLHATTTGNTYLRHKICVIRE